MIYDGLNHARDLGAADANINYAIKKATQYANERDAAEADCKKLKGEIRDHKEEFRQYKHKYNGLVRDFNNLVHTVTEKNEVIEDLEDDVKDYMRIVNQQDAEIAQLKALLEEHGISTEPSGGIKP